MLSALWSITSELAPWLLLGAAVAAALHVLIPPGLLRRELSGYSGIAKAVGLGVPLPLCSCGVIPAGIGLKKDGASDGASIGFLISTPQTGVDSVLVAATFLGWPFALFKIFAAGLTGLVGGALVEATQPVPEGVVLHNPTTERPRTWHDGWEHGVMLLQTIWRWLVFGVVVSALLTVYVPTGSLTDSVLGTGPIAVLAVLALSVPLYVCATASVPIAASLVAAGLPTGAALVFLMAGPATNVATIGAVHRSFGRRVTGIYLGTVVLGSAALGLAFDALWGATAVAAIQHEHTTWWAQSAAVLLLCAMAYFAAEELRAWWRATGALVSEQDNTFDLRVDGLSCWGCSVKLDGALWKVEGVKAVNVSHDDDRAVVVGSMAIDSVLAAIREAGFTPVV
jgi:hypothetical protein